MFFFLMILSIIELPKPIVPCCRTWLGDYDLLAIPTQNKYVPTFVHGDYRFRII